jgi:hypothetical protein
MWEPLGEDGIGWADGAVYDEDGWVDEDGAIGVPPTPFTSFSK